MKKFMESHPEWISATANPDGVLPPAPLMDNDDEKKKKKKKKARRRKHDERARTYT